MKKLEILLPVLNEELQLENGIAGTIDFLAKINFSDYELFIIDNGSTDGTEKIARELCAKHGNIRYLKLSEKGVGLAFREGVKHSESEIVGYMDIDLATDVKHLQDVLRIFDDKSVDMVNASRLAKGSKMSGRKWYRRLTTHMFPLLMKIFLRMKASDAICGFKFFKRESLEKIMRETSIENGWFYIVEILIRAERKGLVIRELPVTWQDELHTKVKFFALVMNYLRNIFRLRKIFKIEGI